MKSFWVYLILLLVPYLAQAIITDEYKMPEQAPVLTNRNEVNKEFDTHIESRADFDAQVNGLKSEAVSAVGQGEVLEVLKPDATNEKIQKLKKMDPYSLEAEARHARGAEENAYFDDFETDYSVAGRQVYRDEAKQIADATTNSMEEITRTLKEHGLDCKEELKKTELRDPYYIEIEKAQSKEVSYEPKFCEYLRDKYACLDNMIIHCETRGRKFQPWDPDQKEMIFTGWEIIGNNWYYDIKWKKSRYGIHMKSDPITAANVQKEIAKRLKVNPDQIGDLRINNRGQPPIIYAYEKHVVFSTFIVGYRYRDGEDICEKWGPEIWSETCRISSK